MGGYHNVTELRLGTSVQYTLEELDQMRAVFGTFAPGEPQRTLRRSSPCPISKAVSGKSTVALHLARRFAIRGLPGFCSSTATAEPARR